MPVHTSHFRSFLKGIASRRRSFLWLENSRKLIYPPRGEIWEPSSVDEAMCDAFILFVVSELEEYFEGVIEDGMSAFEDIFKSHVIRKCGAGSDFVEKMNLKKKDLSKNNNANWSRIGYLFEFIGIKKEAHFPPDFWENVDSIVKHRGDLAHKGVSLAIVEDRRAIIAKIEVIIRNLKIFDTQYQGWHSELRSEVARVRALNMNFSPTF